MPAPEITQWLESVADLDAAKRKYKPLADHACLLTEASKDGQTFAAIVRDGEWVQVLVGKMTEGKMKADALNRIANGVEAIVELLENTNYQLEMLRKYKI